MKLSKVFSIITIAVMLLASVSNVAFAAKIGNVTVGGTATAASNKVGQLGNNILNIVQTVGTIAAVIVLVILGIKYMMGSAEEKAEYKKTLLPYVIGAVLVLLAVNIVTWISSAATGFFGA